jgi:hypothetical protein
MSFKGNLSLLKLNYNINNIIDRSINEIWYLLTSIDINIKIDFNYLSIFWLVSTNFVNPTC